MDECTIPYILILMADFFTFSQAAFLIHIGLFKVADEVAPIY